MPVFAVVGQPNKGKSSIVATLAEDERVRIGAIPGTTRNAREFTFTIDGQALYTLVDTPGFQRARAVLDWLKAHEKDASSRAEVVQRFVEAHRADPKFHDECELLAPILAGAGILYVVDGAKPYGGEYEIEMQILRWTGQPRMALINRIGDGDYSEDWRRALDQYFSIVRPFDAVDADFPTRLRVLNAFAELRDAWRDPIRDAVAALERERSHRLRQSAAEISACLCECLTRREQKTLEDPDNLDEQGEALRDALLQAVRRREARARKRVQGFYRHDRADLEEAELPLVNVDLFAQESWELFGLSKEKLVVAGALGGMAAGGSLDLLLGGASLLMGSVVGGIVGGATVWFGSDEVAKVEVLGETLGGKVLTVGPITAVNFPWVLLGRALVHHDLVAERNHARREHISVASAASTSLMDDVAEESRSAMAKLFGRLRKEGEDGMIRADLTAEIETLMKRRQGENDAG